jgi:hypothetical protein
MSFILYFKEFIERDSYGTLYFINDFIVLFLCLYKKKIYKKKRIKNTYKIN